MAPSDTACNKHKAIGVSAVRRAERAGHSRCWRFAIWHSLWTGRHQNVPLLEISELLGREVVPGHPDSGLIDRGHDGVLASDSPDREPQRLSVGEGDAGLRAAVEVGSTEAEGDRPSVIGEFRNAPDPPTRRSRAEQAQQAEVRLVNG